MATNGIVHQLMATAVFLKHKSGHVTSLLTARILAVVLTDLGVLARPAHLPSLSLSPSVFSQFPKPAEFFSPLRVLFSWTLPSDPRPHVLHSKSQLKCQGLQLSLTSLSKMDAFFLS